MTDQELLTELQYTMIETPNSGSAWGSALWTVAEVIDYLNERQRRFLLLTGLVRTRETINAIPNTHRHELPAGCIVLHRVVWRTGAGARTALKRADGYAADQALRTWPYETDQLPMVYMEADPAPKQIQVAPASYDQGIMDLCFTAVAAALSNTGVVLTVPDDWAPVVKYGALADMLSKPGRTQDPARAQYCETRYQAGIESARMAMAGWHG